MICEIVSHSTLEAETVRLRGELQGARLTIGAIDEVLGNGADETLWPPGLTRAEVFLRMKQQATLAQEQAQKLTEEVTRLTARLDLLEPLVRASETFRGVADKYDLEWAASTEGDRLVLHFARERAKDELARMGRFVTFRLAEDEAEKHKAWRQRRADALDALERGPQCAR